MESRRRRSNRWLAGSEVWLRWLDSPALEGSIFSLLACLQARTEGSGDMNATPHDARMTPDGPSMSLRPWKVAAMMLAVDWQLLSVAWALGTPGRFLDLRVAARLPGDAF